MATSIDTGILPDWWQGDERQLRLILQQVVTERLGTHEWGAVEEALGQAEQGHDGQLRKGGRELPYIVHPIRVALTIALEYERCETKLMQIALLHDLLEDSELSAEEIKARFGGEAAEVVAVLTRRVARPKRGDFLDDAYVANIARGGEVAILVKQADKLDNLRDSFQLEDVERRSLYMREAREVFLPLTERLADPALRARVCDRLKCVLDHYSCGAGRLE